MRPALMIPKLRRIELLLPVLVILLLVDTGCNTRPYVTQERWNRGLVVILPGIEGPSVHNANIRRGLYDGGLPYALEIYNWHGGKFGPYYAFDEPEARIRAGELAAHIRRYRREYPQRPVFVVGHSGGGAITVFTAEEFAADVPLDGVMMLAPALSPYYDLTRAVAGAGGHIVNCCAPNDYFLKSLTSAGRNFDGEKGDTAGQEGFKLPEDASVETREAFTRLVQIHWSRDMRQESNRGGHNGWTNPSWIAATIVPIIDDWAGMPISRGTED